MLKVFRGNIVLQMGLVVAALGLLWIRSLMTPPVMEADPQSAILYQLLSGWLSGVPTVAVVIAMLLVLTEGVLLNILLAREGLVSQDSLLPTLLYVVVTSAGATTLTPNIIVCGITLVCLDQLMLRSTLLTIPTTKAFGATALIGIATLFHVPAITLMISYLLIAANFRLYGWKDWAVMILGFLAPYMLVLTTLYLTDGIEVWWAETQTALTSISLNIGSSNTLQTIGFTFLLLILLWCMLNTLTTLNERPVMWQRNASTVLLLTVGSMGMALYQPLTSTTLQDFAIPFSFCVAHTFLRHTPQTTAIRRKKQTWIYDILFIITLTAAILC